MGSVVGMIPVRACHLRFNRLTQLLCPLSLHLNASSPGVNPKVSSNDKKNAKCWTWVEFNPGQWHRHMAAMMTHTTQNKPTTIPIIAMFIRAESMWPWLTCAHHNLWSRSSRSPHESNTQLEFEVQREEGDTNDMAWLHPGYMCNLTKFLRHWLFVHHRRMMTWWGLRDLQLWSIVVSKTCTRDAITITITINF